MALACTSEVRAEHGCVALRQRLLALPSWSFMNMWCPDSSACVNACVFGPRPCAAAAASVSSCDVECREVKNFGQYAVKTGDQEKRVWRRHLEVLAAHEAGVHVDWAERDGAALLKVEVEVLWSTQNDEQLLDGHHTHVQTLSTAAGALPLHGVALVKLSAWWRHGRTCRDMVSRYGHS